MEGSGSLLVTENDLKEGQTNGIGSTKEDLSSNKESEHFAPVKLRTRKDRVRVRLRSSSPSPVVLQNGYHSSGTPPMSPTFTQPPPRPKSLPPAPPPKSRFSNIAGPDVFIFPPEGRQRRLSNSSMYSDISDVSDTSTTISPLSGRLIPCRPRIKPPPPPPPRPNLVVQSIPIGQWRRRSSFNNTEGDNNSKDLDELTDEGVKRRHLHLVAAKKTFEKGIAQKLADEIAAKDQLTRVLNDVKTHKAEPRVKNTAQEVKNIIESKIIKSEDGDRVYRVVIKMGEFSSNVTHTLMQREVLIQGSMVNNDKLTKEINVEFPEKINMEKFELSAENGIIRILVPFYSRQELIEMEKDRRGLQPITEDGCDSFENYESKSSQDIDKFMESIRNKYKRENTDSISLSSLRKENNEGGVNGLPSSESSNESSQPAEKASEEFLSLFPKTSSDNSDSDNVSVLQPSQLSQCLNTNQRAALKHLANFNTKDKIANAYNRKRSPKSRYINVGDLMDRNGTNSNESNGSNPDSDLDSVGVDTDSSNSDSVFSSKTSNTNDENVTQTEPIAIIDNKACPSGGSTDLVPGGHGGEETENSTKLQNNDSDGKADLLANVEEISKDNLNENKSSLEGSIDPAIDSFHDKNDNKIKIPITQDSENCDIKCSQECSTECSLKLSESKQSCSDDSLLEQYGKNNNILEKPGCQDLSDSFGNITEGLSKSLQNFPLDDTVSSTMTADSAFVSIGSGESESE